MEINIHINRSSSQDDQRTSATPSTKGNNEQSITFSNQSNKPTNLIKEQSEISAVGKSLSLLVQEASNFLLQERLPDYLPLSRNQALLDQAVNYVVDRTNMDIDEGGLRRSLAQEYRILDKTPTLNASADSGNVFDFLTNSDRKELEAAYDYSVDNQLNLDDVELAAGLLAIDRRRKAAVASGTIYKFHEPTKNAGQFVPQSSIEKLTKISSSDPQNGLKDRVLSGELFRENSYLNQALFIESAYRILNLSGQKSNTTPYK